MFIVVLGTIGSGKGTQSAILAKKFHIPLVDTGELLRRENSLKNFLKQGELASDSVVKKVILRFLLSHNTKKGVIFDGFPRTVSQINILQQFREKFSLGEPVVLYLKLPKQEAIERLKFRHRTKPRSDDNELAMANRFSWSEKIGQKVISNLPKNWRVIEIDAMPGIAEIATKIEKKLFSDNG